MIQEAGSPRHWGRKSLPLDFPASRTRRSTRLLTMSHSVRGVVRVARGTETSAFKDGVKTEEPRLAMHRKHLERHTPAFTEDVKAESGRPTKPVSGDHYLLRRKNFPRGSYMQQASPSARQLYTHFLFSFDSPQLQSL